MKKKYLLLCSISLVSLVSLSYAESNYQTVINQAFADYKSETNGKVANYIPALAKYSPHLFGIALITVDGKIYTVGDSEVKFPLESLSKIFALSLVLQQYGANTILQKLGSNATGLPFNSVLAVEQQQSHTGNAIVNAGAMSTVSLIKADNKEHKWNLIQDNLNKYADTQLELNYEVYKSEMETNQHNQGIAKILQSYRRIYSNTDEAVELYTKECSVNVSTIELAKMGAVIANGGKSPFNNKQLIDSKLVPSLLAEMTMSGLYDTSGDWLYQVGLPAKSGVGGGILAIYPGKFAIAVYSPPLDEAGNSVRGQEAIKYIANQLNANIFAVQ